MGSDFLDLVVGLQTCVEGSTGDANVECAVEVDLLTQFGDSVVDELRAWGPYL